MKKNKIIIPIAFISLFLITGFSIVFIITSLNDDNSAQDKDQIRSQVKDSLLWENDQKFQELRSKIQAEKRMSFFKTTLPDPLPGEEDNVALAADFLAGSIVQAGEVFSLNKTIGPFSAKRGYKKGPTYRGTEIVESTGGGVCKIATTLYNVVILANLKVIERHAHGMPVPYVPPGQDATISYAGKKDFKFTNTLDKPVLIWADTKGKTLYMAIYSSVSPPQVKWGHKVINRVKYKTIYKENPGLAVGEKKIVVPGADGMTVRSWLRIKYKNGRVERKDLNTDKYLPLTRVVERNK